MAFFTLTDDTIITGRNTKGEHFAQQGQARLTVAADGRPCLSWHPLDGTAPLALLWIEVPAVVRLALWRAAVNHQRVSEHASR